MSTQTKKILIAEDEKPMANALELKLKNAGFDVTVAFNGKEAMKAINTSSFDLILLDLIMPRIDGFALLSRIKPRPGSSKPYIIVLSNLSQDEDVERGRRAGANEYFIKSNTSLKTITEHIKTVLNKNSKS